MKYLLIVFILIGFYKFSHAQDLNRFFELAGEFMEEYVEEGRVDYKDIKSDPEDLEQLYQIIGDADLSSIDPSDKKAFLINSYNLLVIYQVVDNYPIASPMDVKGFFDNTRHQVAGKMVTLNELEKDMIFDQFRDARLHFVLVCAAKSCPPLLSEAYLPATVEEQIRSSTLDALNNPEFIRVKDNEVQLSKIFEWYLSDFTTSAGTLTGYINQFRNSKISEGQKVTFYEYDWSLNE